jgi:hypothetical protein
MKANHFLKMKTVSAALVLCLNIGVDPPDVVKTNLSSKIECWISNDTNWLNSSIKKTIFIYFSFKYLKIKL